MSGEVASASCRWGGFVIGRMPMLRVRSAGPADPAVRETAVGGDPHTADKLATLKLSSELFAGAGEALQDAVAAEEFEEMVEAGADAAAGGRHSDGVDEGGGFDAERGG